MNTPPDHTKQNPEAEPACHEEVRALCQELATICQTYQETSPKGSDLTQPVNYARIAPDPENIPAEIACQKAIFELEPRLKQALEGTMIGNYVRPPLHMYERYIMPSDYVISQVNILPVITPNWVSGPCIHLLMEGYDYCMNPNDLLKLMPKIHPIDLPATPLQSELVGLRDEMNTHNQIYGEVLNARELAKIPFYSQLQTLVGKEIKIPQLPHRSKVTGISLVENYEERKRTHKPAQCMIALSFEGQNNPYTPFYFSAADLIDLKKKNRSSDDALKSTLQNIASNLWALNEEHHSIIGQADEAWKTAHKQLEPKLENVLRGKEIGLIHYPGLSNVVTNVHLDSETYKLPLSQYWICFEYRDFNRKFNSTLLPLLVEAERN